MTEKSFQNYGKIYQLLYSDKNYELESDYIVNLLAEQNINSGALLELGCGTGIHGNILANKGFNVTGIEQSLDMISQSKQSNNFKIINGDICDTRLGNKYDAVLGLFHVFSYQTSPRKLNQLFKNVSDHLGESGIVIFDVWYTPAVFSLKPETRIKYAFNENLEITRVAEASSFPNKSQVKIKYTFFVKDNKKKTITSFSEIHKMRHFTLFELECIAEKYGLRLILSEEFMTRAPLSDQTWGACLIFRKK